MQELAGPLTPKKERALLRQKEEIDKAEEQIELLNEQRRDGQISLQELIKQQANYSEILERAESFDRVYERYLYVKENPDAVFMNDLGYEKLFGISEPDFSVRSTVLFLFVFSLCLCSLYATDCQTDMQRLLGSTAYGAEKTRREKEKVAFCLTVFIFLIASLPDVIYIARFYGFPNLCGGLVNIPALSHFGRLPIWLAVAGLYLFRLAAFLTLIPILSFLSLKSKNNIATALLGIALFAAPIGIVHIFREKLPVDLSLLPLFSGNILQGKKIHPALLQAGVLIVIDFLCRKYVCRRFGKVQE